MANNKLNSTEMAKFVDPTSSKRRLQSRCLDFIQGKKYLHCFMKPDFSYQPSFSQKTKLMINIFLPFSMFAFSRLRNKQGIIVRTGFDC